VGRKSSCLFCTKYHLKSSRIRHDSIVLFRVHCSVNTMLFIMTMNERHVVMKLIDNNHECDIR
jgi:hypothetical protein